MTPLPVLLLGIAVVACSAVPAPQCNAPHEKYIDCFLGECGPKTCKDLMIQPPCPGIQPPCDGGCICEAGYLRNSEGICIKRDQCAIPTCGTNEEWAWCHLSYVWEMCGRSSPFAADDPNHCYPRCACKKGFRRMRGKGCIPEDDCP